MSSFPPHQGVSHIKFNTTVGSFTIELYPLHSPLTCYNLTLQSLTPYFANTPIHRIVKNNFLQLGDPTGTGRGGTAAATSLPTPGGNNAVPVNEGSGFKPEIIRELKHTGAGILSMCTNPTSNLSTSQFLITLKPCPSFDGKYGIFGRITSGMGVVERIGMVEVDDDERPKNKISIISTECFDSEGERVGGSDRGRIENGGGERMRIGN